MDLCLLGKQNALCEFHPILFQTFTNFTFGEFEELVWQVVPTIIDIKYTRFVGDPHYISWQLSKLTP